MPTSPPSHTELLSELTQMAMELARTIHAQALENPTPELTTQFDRVARCVRRTILLARKLAEPDSAAPDQTRITARKQIIRKVEDAIVRNGKPGDATRLTREFLDRRDAPETEDDLATTPLAHIIEDICRDLGIAADPWGNTWARRDCTDIQRLTARAAAPPRHRASPPHPNPLPEGARKPSPSGRGLGEGAGHAKTLA